MSCSLGGVELLVVSIWLMEKSEFVEDLANRL